MRILKGIVFEKKSDYMIFLTKEGEFLKGIPIADDVGIGDDVLFQITTTSASMKTKKLKLYGPLVAAAAIILLIFATLFQANNHVHAYVQLEMEHSLEFGLDKNGQVITCRLLDEDVFLTKDELAKWKGESISVVLNEVIEVLSTMKQSEDIPNIQITTVYEPVKETIEVKELIENTIKGIRNTHAKTLWDVSESSMDIRKSANQNKMTIQQYNQSSDQSQPAEKIKPTNQNDKDTNKGKKQNGKDSNERKKQTEIEELPKGKSEHNRNDSSRKNGKPKQQKNEGQKDNKEEVRDSKEIPSKPNKQQKTIHSKKTGPNGKNHPHKDKHPGKGKGPEKSKRNSGN